MWVVFDVYWINIRKRGRTIHTKGFRPYWVDAIRLFCWRQKWNRVFEKTWAVGDVIVFVIGAVIVFVIVGRQQSHRRTHTPPAVSAPPPRAATLPSGQGETVPLWLFLKKEKISFSWGLRESSIPNYECGGFLHIWIKYCTHQLLKNLAQNKISHCEISTGSWWRQIVGKEYFNFYFHNPKSNSSSFFFFYFPCDLFSITRAQAFE